MTIKKWSKTKLIIIIHLKLSQFIFFTLTKNKRPNILTLNPHTHLTFLFIFQLIERTVNTDYPSSMPLPFTTFHFMITQVTFQMLDILCKQNGSFQFQFIVGQHQKNIPFPRITNCSQKTRMKVGRILNYHFAIFVFSHKKSSTSSQFGQYFLYPKHYTLRILAWLLKPR